MDRVRALQILKKVRERRTEAFEQAVDAALAVSRDARAQVQVAQDALVEAVSSETRERDKVSSMTEAGRTFDIQTLMLRSHVAETMKDAVASKEQDVERCGLALDRTLQEVRARRGELSRHQRKIEALGQDIHDLLARREQEDDDRQDEEAEEAAIGRMRAPPPDAGDGPGAPA